jgi:hypothetical protein
MANIVEPKQEAFLKPTNVELALTGAHTDFVTATIQEQRRIRSTTARAHTGGGYGSAPTEYAGPAGASYKSLSNTWNPVFETLYSSNVAMRPMVDGAVQLATPGGSPTARVSKPPAAPPPLPSQLGPMIWNPITFHGFETHGHAQLTLFKNGGYEFSGSFVDPSAWDYDDQLVWGVISHTGVLYTFTHQGSMHGWFDRWIEGGSDTDSWNQTGTNAAISGGWADLCAGYYWHAHAGINSDLGGLVKLLKDIIAAIETVVKVIAVVF